MAFNRYTQITPTRYNPRTLQETLYLPTLKRQQHDKIAQDAAVTRSQLDNFDALEEIHGEKAQGIKDQLNSRMEKLTNQLATQGVNSNSRTDFINVAQDYSKQIGESGDLYKMNAIKKKYLADKEKILQEAQQLGNDPSASLANLDDAYLEYSKNYDGKSLDYIDLPNAPTYYGVSDAVKEFSQLVGSDKFVENINPGSYKVDENGIIQIDKESVSSQSNLRQLEKFRDLLNLNLTAKGSRGKATMEWNRKNKEDLQKEIDAVIGTMSSVASIEQKDRSFNFSLLNAKTKALKSKEEEIDTPSDYGSIAVTKTLGLETFEQAQNYLTEAKTNLEKAKINNPSDIKLIREREYDVRILENVVTDINSKVENEFGKNYNEEIEETRKVINQGLSSSLNSDEISEWIKAYNVGNNIPLEENGEVVGNKLAYIDNDGNLSYKIRKNGYNSPSEVIKLDYIQKSGGFLDAIKEQKNIENKYSKLKTDKANELSQEQYLEGIDVIPTFDKPGQNRKEAYGETMRLLQSNSLKPTEVMLINSDNEKENLDVNVPDIQQKVMNFLDKRAGDINVTDIRIREVGNKQGYQIKISPKDDVLIDKGIFGESIDKDDTIEVFIPVNKEDIENNHANSYFTKFMDKENYQGLKRNLEYSNIIPTKNKQNLGRSYDLNFSQFISGEYTEDKADFLETDKGIEIHRIDKNSNGVSKGALTIKEVVDKIAEIQPDVESDYNSAALLDILYNKLTNDQKVIMNESDKPMEYLKETIGNQKLLLNNNSQIPILLSALKR